MKVLSIIKYSSSRLLERMNNTNNHCTHLKTEKFYLVGFSDSFNSVQNVDYDENTEVISPGTLSVCWVLTCGN